MFHIDSTIVAGHLLPALERRLLPGQSVWATHDGRWSASTISRRTEEVVTGWDLVLVDEAHLAGSHARIPGEQLPTWNGSRSCKRRQDAGGTCCC